ncbi:SPOC domain-containing protein 1-like [Sorex araneus]|uniref:SPOC domain-containing protein 1-like n=1 Tax=Sorex araneus TaxID=42254 RepID=UPI002433DB02|nr:SPOC domain-containing protein 1-like [Sorex araneus]
MSREAAAEASGTVDTVLSPSYYSLSSVEVEGQGSLLSWLVPELPGAGWETGVCAGEAHPGACPQPAGAAALSPDTEAHLAQAPGLGQERQPSPKATPVVPVSAQGRTRSSRRLQNSLPRVLARGRPSTQCIVCRDLPQGARELPKAVDPRPGDVGEGGRGAAGWNGMSPSFSKKGSPRRSPSHSPGPAPVRAQKERGRHECSGQGKEAAGGFLWLGGDTTPSESLGRPRGPPSPGSTGSGPGGLGGSWMEWVLGTAEVEGFAPRGDGARTDSPYDAAGSLRSVGGEPPGEATQGPPQSPDPCLDGPRKACTEQRGSGHGVPADADEGCVTPLSPGEQEEQAQAVCRGRPEQGLDSARTSAHCPEPATSKAPSGPATGQRAAHSAETWGRSPELHARYQGTGRISDDASPEHPEHRSAHSCSPPEEMKMPCGAKWLQGR